jgi:hypothetical protein
MQVFIDNWHLILFGAVCIAVLAWEVFVKRKPSSERLIRVLVILFATFGIAYVTTEYRRNQQLEGNVHFFINTLSNRAENDYSKEILGEFENKLNLFTQKGVEALSDSSVEHELLRALRKSSRNVLCLDHYILVWNSHQESELQENLNAIIRGVEVNRIFVISDAITRSRIELQEAFEIMRRQSMGGIKVSYVFQHDLQGYSDYQRFADVDYSLFDEHVLAKISARASPRDLPRYCVLSWDKGMIERESPFPWIKGATTIHNFSHTETKNIDEFVKRAGISVP